MNERLNTLVRDEAFLEKLFACRSAPHLAGALLAAEDIHMEESDVKALLAALYIRYGTEEELGENDLASVAGGVAGFAWLEALPLL